MTAVYRLRMSNEAIMAMDTDHLPPGMTILGYRDSPASIGMQDVVIKDDKAPETWLDRVFYPQLMVQTDKTIRICGVTSDASEVP